MLELTDYPGPEVPPSTSPVTTTTVAVEKPMVLPQTGVDISLVIFLVGTLLFLSYILRLSYIVWSDERRKR